MLWLCLFWLWSANLYTQYFLCCSECESNVVNAYNSRLFFRWRASYFCFAPVWRAHPLFQIPQASPLPQSPQPVVWGNWLRFMLEICSVTACTVWIGDMNWAASSSTEFYEVFTPAVAGVTYAHGQFAHGASIIDINLGVDEFESVTGYFGILDGCTTGTRRPR